MTFDFNISETVSLSKILDCFIEDGESPSLIFSFLDDHKDDVKDILKHSILSDRMVSSDFIYRCSFKEIIKITEMIKNECIKNDIAMYLIWQILQSNITSDVKTLFKSLLSEISLNNPFKYNTPSHPYSGRLGNEARRFDSIFMDSKRRIDDIIYILNDIPFNDFVHYIKLSDKSLWVRRLYQKDIIEGLTADRQWIIINNIGYLRFNLRKFFVQMFISDIDVKMKLKLYELFIDRDYYSTFNELNKLIDDCETFEELHIKMNMWGIDEYISDIVMILLSRRKINFLRKFNELDHETLKDNFDICDLIEAL